MQTKRRWTPEEEEFLSEQWGQMSIPGIAKRLNRTVYAVKIRASKLHLGRSIQAGDYITLNRLIIAVTGIQAGYGYKPTSWVKNRGLPIHMRKVENGRFRVVYLDEFWKWAEKNKSYIDFSRMEPLTLGKEPDWVAEQRKKDYTAYALQRKDRWTSEDDSRLKMLLGKHKYSWTQLTEIMNRSQGAILRRCRDLGIKDRPIPVTPRFWTDEDFKKLADGIRNGDSYASIAGAVKRSEKCVRSKVYAKYLTEDEDKVRVMIGDGPWGYGAPEMDVRHGWYLSSTTTSVKKDIAALIAILEIRIDKLNEKELKIKPFWQRKMCKNWDDEKGCLYGQTGCDYCPDFQRIISKE